MPEQPTTYSLHDLQKRFAHEDIEILCTRTITVQVAFYHPARDDEDAPGGGDEVAYERVLAELHPLDENGDTTGLWSYYLPEETMEDIAAGLGISPDEKVWTLGDPGPVTFSKQLPDGFIVVGHRPTR
jgi:hypothetical protein